MRAGPVGEQPCRARSTFPPAGPLRCARQGARSPPPAHQSPLEAHAGPAAGFPHRLHEAALGGGGPPNGVTRVRRQTGRSCHQRPNLR